MCLDQGGGAPLPQSRVSLWSGEGSPIELFDLMTMPLREARSGFSMFHVINHRAHPCAALAAVAHVTHAATATELRSHRA